MDREITASQAAKKGGGTAITAAVVGVIANLTLWFALHVLFQKVDRVSAGPLNFDLPDWTSLDRRTALLSATALLLVFARRWNVLKTLGVLVLAGLAVKQIG